MVLYSVDHVKMIKTLSWNRTTLSCWDILMLNEILSNIKRSALMSRDPLRRVFNATWWCDKI